VRVGGGVRGFRPRTGQGMFLGRRDDKGMVANHKLLTRRDHAPNPIDAAPGAGHAAPKLLRGLLARHPSSDPHTRLLAETVV